METDAHPLPPPLPPPPRPSEWKKINEVHTRKMHGFDVEFAGWRGGITARLWECPSGAGSVSSSGPLEPAARKLVGLLHKVNGQGVNLTCKEHRDCVCWVTLRYCGVEDLMSDLVARAAQATTGGGNVSAQARCSASRDLKRKHGLRLKEPSVGPGAANSGSA